MKRRENGQGGRRHSWNSARLADRCRQHLGQPLDDLVGKTWDAVEPEPCGNAPCVEPAGARDFGALSSQISLVLDFRFKARDIQSSRTFLELNLAARDDVGEPDLGLPQRPQRRHSSGWRFAHALADPIAILLEPRSSLLENRPALVVHDSRGTAGRRQAQIRIVDAEKQPMFRPGREHAIWLQTTLCY